MFQAIAGAGHHVYVDKPAVFNKIVNDACELTDAGKLSVAQSPLHESVVEQKQTTTSPSLEITNDSDNKSITNDSGSKPIPVTE